MNSSLVSYGKLPQRPHVLLVDDESSVLELLRYALEPMDLELYTCSSAAEATLCLQDNEIHVAFCDLCLGDSPHATPLLRKIKEVHPHSVAILMSGFLEVDSLTEALNEGGIWKCLKKPFTLDTLRNTVTAALEELERRLESEAEQDTIIEETLVVQQNEEEHEPRISIRLPPAKLKPLEDPLTIHGRYEANHKLGEGGLSVVYKADDRILEHPVVLKVLKPGISQDELFKKLFLNEARMTMALSHPHIVRLYSLEQMDEQFYMVMEYVPGRSLRQLIQHYHQLPMHLGMSIIRCCAKALQYAHELGVFHCDIKPDNVLISTEGHVKLIDFGLARVLQNDLFKNLLTGTEDYMSPEQSRGEELNEYSDQFSLGMLACHVLCGRLPDSEVITDENGMEIERVLLEELDGLSDAQKVVLSKALAPTPSERWESVKIFSDALHSCTSEVTLK